MLVVLRVMKLVVLLLPAAVAGRVDVRDYVDPTTPPSEQFKVVPGHGGRPLQLVFSDEFNVDWPANRSWSPTSTVPDRPRNMPQPWSATYTLNTDTYGQTFVHPQMVDASDGVLHLRARKQKFGGADYLGAQLTTWNKLCYQGGYLEVAFKLPGGPGREATGIWTAIWIMGNLARDNFPASVKDVWPFTYDECKCPGLEFTTGLRQKISRCDEHGDRYGLNRAQGRGAPEVDLLETTLCSLQWSPWLLDEWPWLRQNDTCLISSLQLAPPLPIAYKPPILPLQQKPSDEHPWCAFHSHSAALPQPLSSQQPSLIHCRLGTPAARHRPRLTPSLGARPPGIATRSCMATARW